MSGLKKRERALNFEKSEIQLLTELVTKYRSVIENKKTDAVTNKDKEAVWSTIAATFNAASSGSTVRTSKTLKLKYESLKKCAKKKMTLHRQELYRTGGGPSAAPALDDAEEKVMAICSNISGLDARNDSDHFAGRYFIATIQLFCNSMVYQLKSFCIFIDITTKIIVPPNIEEPIITVENADIVVMPATSNEAQTLSNEYSQIYEENKTHNCGSDTLNDVQNKWTTWNPKCLKSKVSQALKPSKATVTAKLDDLSTARLELVRLQKDIAIKEHLFVEEEHKLKMLHLKNEEARKQELHCLMLAAMQQKSA